MFKLDLQIRPGDCDAYGHVNNATYVSYIQHALAEYVAFFGLRDDWSREGDYAWSLGSMSIEYRQAARLGDRLKAGIWLEETANTAPVFGCEIWRFDEENDDESGQVVVRSRSLWRRISRQTDEPFRLQGSTWEDPSHDSGKMPRPFALPEDTDRVRNYHWDHEIMVSELGPDGNIHPQAIYHWLEMGLFSASAQGGWPAERRLAAGFVVLQMRHDTEFYAHPDLGDNIRVTGRLIESRRLRGTWLLEIHKLPGRQLLTRDYSTGVYLNLEGRPATPPAEMIQELQFGQEET